MASTIKVDTIQSTTSNVVIQNSAGTEYARFDASGNFGIGTNSPGTQLNVYKSTATAVNIRPQNSLSYADFGPQADGGVYAPYASPAASTYLIAGTTNSNPFVFYTNGSERMRIDSSGKVAIGTSTPNASAVTTVKSPSASEYQIQLEQSNVTDGYALRCSASNGDLTFSRYASSAYSERMRLDLNGNLQVGYGGQSPTAFAAPQGMTIGSLDNVALQYYLRKGNQVEARIGFKASTDSNFYVGSGGGTGPGGIGAYGVYLTNLGSSWNAVSDERKKTIVEPIENAAEKVSSLRAVIGYYNNDESQTRRPFLIAQDVQEVLPEAVNIQDVETGTLGMSYTDTIPLLVAAIKEQQVIITQLQADVAALKAK